LALHFALDQAQYITMNGAEEEDAELRPGMSRLQADVLGEGKRQPYLCARELDTIFKLNRAGRRYLIQEGPESIANGIEVLVAMRDDLGCLFYHLLENPTLCDIEH
jgi:hypothetical protein